MQKKYPRKYSLRSDFGPLVERPSQRRTFVKPKMNRGGGKDSSIYTWSGGGLVENRDSRS